MATFCYMTVGSPTVVALGSMFETIRVNKSISHESDSFTATMHNPGGRRSGLFSIGQQVDIYHDIVSPGSNNQIFLGTVEFVNHIGNGPRETIMIGGRDYTNRLMDNRVQNVYLSGTNNVCEVGSIVRDIIWTSAFSGTIGTDQVSGVGTILQAFAIKNKTVYEAVAELSHIAGYDFYVNFSKELVFRPQNNQQTGYTLGSGNSVLATIDRNTKDMFNFVTVYGDRQIVRDQETFTADGVGSVFTLLAKPHDTYVTVDGTKKLGGVFELVNFLPTGTQYLVDYDQRNIIFISGTSVGDNLPGSLASVVVQYGKGVPIAKQVSDEQSITSYGLKENVITNLEIKDPNQALNVALAELELYKDPALEASVELSTAGISGIQPGQTVIAHFPMHNISGTVMKVLQTTYDITQENLRGNRVISVLAGNRIRTISDELQQIILKIRALQARDAETTDAITRVKTSTGSLYEDYNWTVSSRTLGSGYVLGHSVYGVLGNFSENRAFYRLNSIDTVQTDASQYANNGSVFGTVTLVDGPFGGIILGSAVNFVGGSETSVIVPGNSANNIIGGQVTVTAWANPATLIAAGVTRLVVKRDEANNQSSYHLSYNVNNQVQFGVASGTLTAVATLGSPSITTGSWFRFVGVYNSDILNGRNLLLYKNGVCVAAGSISTINLGSAIGSLHIGNNPAVASRFYDGYLSDVRVYANAWSQEDVLSDFNGGSGKVGVGSHVQNYFGDSRSSVTDFDSGGNWAL